MKLYRKVNGKFYVAGETTEGLWRNGVWVSDTSPIQHDKRRSARMKTSSVIEKALKEWHKNGIYAFRGSDTAYLKYLLTEIDKLESTDELEDLRETIKTKIAHS